MDEEQATIAYNLRNKRNYVSKHLKGNLFSSLRY